MISVTLAEASRVFVSDSWLSCMVRLYTSLQSILCVCACVMCNFREGW